MTSSIGDMIINKKISITLERVTQSRVVKLYKVVWSNHGERDATWEREDYLKDNYSTFYEKWYDFQISGRNFYKGEGCNTPGVCLASVHHMSMT
jgi:hypothetical protein